MPTAMKAREALIYSLGKKHATYSRRLPGNAIVFLLSLQQSIGATIGVVLLSSPPQVDAAAILSVMIFSTLTIAWEKEAMPSANFSVAMAFSFSFSRKDLCGSTPFGFVSLA